MTTFTITNTDITDLSFLREGTFVYDISKQQGFVLKNVAELIHSGITLSYDQLAYGVYRNELISVTKDKVERGIFKKNFILTSQFSIPESSPIGTIAGNLELGIDVPTYNYSLVNHTDTFEIINGIIKTKSLLDYETRINYILQIRIEDRFDSSRFWLETINISVINVIDTITLNTIRLTHIAENTAIGTVILNLTQLFTTEDGFVPIFSLNDNTDKFAVSGNNLIVAGSLNYELVSSYNISVRIQEINNATNFWDMSVIVNIDNVMDTLSISTPISVYVDEFVSSGTLISNLIGFITLESGMSVHMILNNYTDMFSIVGTQLKVIGTVSYTMTPQYVLHIDIIDNANSSNKWSFDVTVNVRSVTPPSTIRFEALNVLPTPIYQAGKSVTLSDGRILVVGGMTSVSVMVDTSFIMDRGTVIEIAPFPIPIAMNDITLLSDGRILVVGGMTLVLGSPITTNVSYLGTIVGNHIDWIQSTNSPNLVHSHTLTTLSDGRIIIIGSHDTNEKKTYIGTVTGNIISWVGVSSPGNNTLRDHSTVLLSDGRLLVCGGSVFSTISANTYFATITGNSIIWATGTALPISLITHTVTVTGPTEVTVLGGWNSSGYSADTYVGYISGNSITWNLGTALPYPMANHSTSLDNNGKINIFGGVASQTDTNSITIGAKNGNTIVWTSSNLKNAVTPTHTIAYHTTNNLSDGRLLVAGGFNGSAYLDTIYFGTVLGSDILWTKSVSKLPSKNGYHTMNILSEDTLLLTGGVGTGASSVYFGTVIGDTVSWVSSTSLPLPLQGHQCNISNGRILITGGYSGGSKNTTIIGDIRGTQINWIYSTVLPKSAHYHSTITLNDGRVMVCGSGYTKMVAIGTIIGDSISWVNLLSNEMPHGVLYGSGMLLPDGRVMIYGGIDNTSASEPVPTIATINGDSVTWTTSTPYPYSLKGGTCTMLSDGRNIVIGGAATSSLVLGRTYFFKLTI